MVKIVLNGQTLNFRGSKKMILTEEQIQRIKGTELSFKTSRSGGKGGQNVNKVETKVELEFAPSESLVLNDLQKQIIAGKSGVQPGESLKVISEKHRSQLRNKEEAAEKLVKILQTYLTPVKKRRATRPGKAAKEKKLKDKKIISEKKSLRRKDF